MSSPFSDTSNPSPMFGADQDQADRLAKRLGLPPINSGDLGRWQRMVFSAMHVVLDRLEALERGALAPKSHG